MLSGAGGQRAGGALLLWALRKGPEGALRARQVHLAAEAMGLATSVLLLALGFRRHRMQARAPHRAAGRPAALLLTLPA
jgi:hypothetical protein